jgi:hypothetical protein
LAFDTPVPFSTMGRRNVSNVPAQALILLNDPLVVELSRKWANRALEQVPVDGKNDLSKRIHWLYLAAFGRPPTQKESLAANHYLTSKSAEYGVSTKDAGLWADLTHVLVNTKEFIYLR